MKRATLVMALVLVASALGCGGGGGTFVVVRVEAGTTGVSTAHTIDLETMLGVRSATVPIARDNGTDVMLPAEKALEILTGSGTLSVRAVARDSAGNQLASGSAAIDVARGSTVRLTVVLGQQMSLLDGGPDGQTGDGGPQTDGQAPAPVLVIDNATHDFGVVVVGSPSSVATFKVSNTGNGSSGSLSALVGGPDAARFSLSSDLCSGTTLAPGASCNFGVIFTPTAPAAVSATVTVSGSPGGSVQSALMGTGTPPGALAIAPASHAYGPLTVGMTSAATVYTVTNTGGAASGSLTTSLTGTDAGQFMISADTCSGMTLAPAATCTVSAVFKPTMTGARSASLVVTASPGGTAASALTGMGLSVAALDASPNPLSYGTPLVGAMTDRTLTVSNGGGSATGPLTFTLTGPNAGDFSVLPAAGGDCPSGSPLATGASCTLRVRLVPTLSGARTATLTINAAPGGPATVSLTGTAQVPATLVGAPASFAFGQLEAGMQSAAQTWTIMNTGDVPSGIPTLTSSGAGAQFTPTSTCTSAIPAGGSCTVSFLFAPTSGGAFTATYTLSAAPGGSAAITLTGTGMVRLTVAKIGAGAAVGLVTGTPGIDCGATCSALYPSGTFVTLQARTMNGQNIHFAGWTGACASTGSARDCTVNVSSSITATANFAANDANLVFLSSGLFPTNLGTVAAYDTACNTAASNAGINNSAGSAYIAWVALASNLPQTRLGTARGFKLLDGRAFSDRVADLTGATPKIWNPIDVDETGVLVKTNQREVISSALMDGTAYSGNCQSWTSSASADNFGSGASYAGPETWTYAGPNTCTASSTSRLFCFQKTATLTITTPPATATGTVKHIFVTKGTFLPGGGAAAADVLCNSAAEKPAGTGPYRALLATTTVTPASLINTSATYASPDLQLVGTGQELVNGGALETGIWQAGDKTFPVGFATGLVYAWSGSGSPSQLGTTATNCNDFTSTSGNGNVGFFEVSSSDWWNYRAVPCNVAHQVYCAEQ